MQAFAMSESQADKEQNLGKRGHWTKGANMTRDGHQIKEVYF